MRDTAEYLAEEAEHEMEPDAELLSVKRQFERWRAESKTRRYAKGERVTVFNMGDIVPYSGEGRFRDESMPNFDGGIDGTVVETSGTGRMDVERIEVVTEIFAAAKVTWDVPRECVAPEGWWRI